MAQRRRLLVLLVLCAATSLMAEGASAWSQTTFAGPKSWLQGWDASGWWDTPNIRWQTVDMTAKSCYCSARVAFIDNVSYGWSCSVTNSNLDTGCVFFYGYDFTKKPYCKNNSSTVYTARCDVGWNF
jgi:hypothetical protein